MAVGQASIVHDCAGCWTRWQVHEDDLDSTRCTEAEAGTISKQGARDPQLDTLEKAASGAWPYQRRTKFFLVSLPAVHEWCITAPDDQEPSTADTRSHRNWALLPE